MKLVRLLAVAALVTLAQAHVGSPDIYLDAQAGPYRLFITVRPPIVIPGVAELQVRAASPGVREIRAVPVPLTAAGAQFAPVSDKLKVSLQDPKFFTGSLWIMASGSWQVRITADGTAGQATVAIPVPAVALTTKPMTGAMSLGLGLLMLLLVLGLVLISGASVREAKLPVAVEPSPEQRARARRAMVSTAILVVGIIAFGRWWWQQSEAAYRNKVYQPLRMEASASQSGVLQLHITNPPWMNRPLLRGPQNGTPLFTRLIDDFVPDHDHLMHLYAIRQPGLEVVYHLHPEQIQTGTFHLQLPSMEPGSYRLYADVVHANGFAETMVAPLAIPPFMHGKALSGDDAYGTASPWNKSGQTNNFLLPDGLLMEWIRPAGALHARAGLPFRFRLLDGRGQAARDMQLYMGMPGHAAFLKTDGSAFAHVHPAGSVSMAAYMLAQHQLPSNEVSMAAMDMGGMESSGLTSPAAVPNEVTFPYGFPSPGRYRIFVQMKHAGVVETGIFDASVVR